MSTVAERQDRQEQLAKDAMTTLELIGEVRTLRRVAEAACSVMAEMDDSAATVCEERLLNALAAWRASQ